MAWDFSLVDPNLVCANMAVVNVGILLLFLLRNDVIGVGLVELLVLLLVYCWDDCALELGDTDPQPGPAGVGEDGDALRLLSDDDSESMGLKHWASGLNVLLAAWISLSRVSKFS